MTGRIEKSMGKKVNKFNRAKTASGLSIPVTVRLEGRAPFKGTLTDIFDKGRRVYVNGRGWKWSLNSECIQWPTKG